MRILYCVLRRRGGPEKTLGQATAKRGKLAFFLTGLVVLVIVMAEIVNFFGGICYDNGIIVRVSVVADEADLWWRRGAGDAGGSCRCDFLAFDAD